MAQQVKPSEGRESQKARPTPPSTGRVTKTKPGKRVSHKDCSKRVGRGK